MSRMSTRYNIAEEDKKVLKEVCKRTWFLFAGFNYVNLQGCGFSKQMIPMINHVYKDDEEARKRALVRSMGFFNCTYETATFIVGLNCAMEKQNSLYDDFDESSINAVKVSLMGPLSGIGDSIFWGVVRLLASSIAIPIAAQGNIFGPILFMLAYHIPSIITRYNLFYLGFTMGENFLTTIHNSGMFRYLTYSITVIGTIMVGAMSAQHVRVATPMVFEFDGGNLVLQDTLDAIMRGILPLIVVMTCFYFLRKKVKITTVMLGVMAFAIFGAFIGLF